jgi:hypothetical protein
MEYLAEPTVEDPEKQDEFLEKWAALGYGNYFLYSQAEKILAVVRDMTAAGTITWTVGDGKDRGGAGQYFCADVGDLLFLLFHPPQAPGRAPSAVSSEFCIMSSDDSDSDIEMQIDHAKNNYQQQCRVLAEELNVIILKKLYEEKAKFDKIVRDNIVHDILASLDSPSKEPSSLEGI